MMIPDYYEVLVPIKTSNPFINTANAFLTSKHTHTHLFIMKPSQHFVSKASIYYRNVTLLFTAFKIYSLNYESIKIIGLIS
jgi:hypothetical protein